MQFRGGSSKGMYFSASDLPEGEAPRDQLLLDALGRDPRQIDGVGGAHPLTSKIAIISPSQHPGADVDYLFVQVVVGENRVDTTPNCGNILAGVGPYAIECGMVSARRDNTRVRVRMVNSDNLCELVVQTPGGKVEYQGDTRIDGVPGSAAPVVCNYMDTAGSICGSLLPTGNAFDEIDGVPVTCIDNGMPVVLVRASDLGLSGYENCETLSADSGMRQRLESIRIKAGPMMNLGDVTEKVVPKMSIVAAPVNGGSICTRTFIPHTCHAAIGVLGAVSVATACTLTGSVTENIAVVPPSNTKAMSIEHPSGEFTVELQLDDQGNVVRSGLLRTARLLSKGELFV